MTLVLDRVSHRYVSERGDVVHAVADTTVTIPDGQFTCVVGPSGCGKTTLLKVLAGFLHPTGGAASIDGEPITAPSPHRGVVFQHPNLYPWLTVRRNVELGLKFQGVPARDRAARSAEQLERVGLAGFADHRPYELSGGMQQRAQIARVLTSDPDVILMDEPFGALDAQTRELMQEELNRIWQASGTTVVFITHDIYEAVFLGDRVVVMSGRPGRILEDVTIDLPRPRGGDVKGSKEFGDYHGHLWSLLRDEAAKAESVRR